MNPFDDDEIHGYDDAAGSEDTGATEAQEAPGPELVVGGMLFLAGCLPAAAVAKALFDGTDLASDGLRRTAALAAMVAGWVGPWPALLVSVAITAIGTLMILGTLRTEPMRYVGGALVSGLGLAAIASAMALGAGGSLGDGTGGALAGALGAWSGILLGLGVIAVALWLAFVRQPSTPAEADVDTDVELEAAGPFDAPETDDSAAVEDVSSTSSSSLRDTVAGAVASAVERVAAIPAAIQNRRAARSAIGKSVERRKRVATRTRRHGEPQTLGDALVRDDIEGVSHDEAAALAPDDKTLAYMEEVWRRASQSYQQPAPVPPSPYPEDVRLQGGIPPGAVPFVPPGEDGAGEPAEAAPAETPGPLAAPTAPVPASEMRPTVPADEVAPFDFVDEAASSTIQPIQPIQPVAQPFVTSQPTGGDDPFGAASPVQPLSNDEAAALEAAVLREGASQEGPRELPPGVQPLAASPPQESVDVASVGDLLGSMDATVEDPATLPELDETGELAPPLMPPPASWEVGYEDSEDSEDEASKPIPDVDPTGRWQRREGEAEPLETPAGELDDDPAEFVEPATDAVESAAVEVAEPLVAEVEDEDEHGVEAELESELDGEEDVEAELEVEEPVEAEAEQAEEEDDEEDEPEEAEAEEYEYVDEDGNPIDPEDLEEGEYEYVVEGEAEEEDEDEDEEEEDDADAEYEEYDEEDEYEEADEDEEDEDAEAELEEDEEDEESDDPAFESPEDGEYEEAFEEAEVVLEPQAPPTGASRDATRILEAGLIVVREGRVAVSVLQRELEMEFDEACELLDQLQGEGLIGPYKGGKKRDILLTEEEWEGRFARS